MGRRSMSCAMRTISTKQLCRRDAWLSDCAKEGGCLSVHVVPDCSEIMSCCSNLRSEVSWHTEEGPEIFLTFLGFHLP